MGAVGNSFSEFSTASIGFRRHDRAAARAGGFGAGGVVIVVALGSPRLRIR